ncbi:MAG: D-3-phosphoglycerate dehydrogenase / 2-oxoglutarate reductase [Acidobacteriota bacterium]|jgi:D-3-phosphoglycerate dehydrogenase|nr:D-3-phosphoglycerate dehydrogenase / 2-oxoglutarate reductase [Acidobacteriota bacterium]
MSDRILIADQLDPSGLEMLQQAGAEIHQLTKEERERLPEILADYDALVVRSATKVTADLLRAGKRLKVVGRAGIGVDNVDVAAATELGILVVNAPTANLTSATEHTFALLLSLARRIPLADASTKAGGWDRKITGVELQGKTLGVVGFGRIGQKVADRARGFEMQIAAYDPFLDAAAARKMQVELLSLDELLARADVVTLHTPFTPETRNLINRERLARMKPGALLVNCARGGIVDEEALLEALESGHLGGAALDVFAEEPPTDLRLVRHPKVVATPHLGAQTHEAQERISRETAEMVLAALAGSMAVAAVNLPFRPAGGKAEPYLALGERLGGLAGQLLGTAPQLLKVDLWGIEEAFRVPVAVAVLKGVLTTFLGEGVNYVNSERIAEQRGIEVVRSTHSAPGDYPHLVSVTLSGGSGGSGGGRTVEIDGTLFREREPRVVRLGGYPLEFRPEGWLLFLENADMPGVVGKIGTLLAGAQVNIADIHLARRPKAGSSEREALAVLRLDQAADDELVSRLAALPEVISVRSVDLQTT